MKDSAVIRLLYDTQKGRKLLKVLVNPKLSKVAAFFFSSRLSACIIPWFVRKNQIDLTGCIIPPGGYASFNDFFTRKRIQPPKVSENDILVAPSDGLLTVSPIDDDSIFHIKHTNYSLKSLLNDADLADAYKGGTALIFRLTPSHYHRYIFSTSGELIKRRKIKGLLHSVQPICHDRTDVFVQNSRRYVEITNSILGGVIQMEVGALLVGKISNHSNNALGPVRIGEEKGYFEYGGSSIVVLTKQPIALNEKIRSRKKIDTEIPVKIGENLI